MSDKGVVFLAFRNDAVKDEMVNIGTCAHCRNKTYVMIHDNAEYPLLKCAACGAHIGRVGWAS